MSHHPGPHQTLIILARAPVAGRTKTRLGRDIGMTAAAAWYRAQLSRLLRRVGQDPRWHTLVALSPDTSAARPPPVFRGVSVIRQGTGDLGRRMLRPIAAAPPGRALVIGSDVPGVTAKAVATAFNALRGADSVLGPAPDGGFWLIGFRRGAAPLPPSLLDGVAWSTDRALVETEARLAPRRIAHATTLRDVDRAADLRGP